MATKTTVRSPRHQGEMHALCEVGQGVRVTGQADGSPTTSVHEGIVTRVVEGVDGRLRVTLGHGGTNPQTVTVAADEIYVTVGGRPFPNVIPDATTICTHADHGTPGRCPGCGTYLTDLSSAELATARTINDEIVAAITPGEEEVTVYLDSPNGPRAHYLGSLEIEAVLARLPAGWTVHESDWSNAVQIDDLTWSVPLTKIE